MKKEILGTLKNNLDTYVSGEELSHSIGVTRAAIWKHIKQLKEEGYEIEAISRKGYRLIKEPDVLDSKALEIELRDNSLIKKIEHYDTLDSTNSKAKLLASQGASEGTVVICEEQMGGRGRLGRKWISPKGTGIWLSIILRPQIGPQEATIMTQITAAAVALAIKNLTGIHAGIKWPNDIIIGGKKACGILTEMSGELNSVNYIVVGIGVNVNMDNKDFSDEVRTVATSIKEFYGKPLSRKALVIKILNEFENLYLDFINTNDVKKSISICKDLSVTLGKEVRIVQRGKTMVARALDITEDGELLVKDNNGNIQKVVSGEVSVRGITDYI